MQHVVESGQFVGADGQIMDVSDFGESEGDDDAADAAPTPASKKAPAKAAEPEQPKDSVDLPACKPATVTEDRRKAFRFLSLTKIRNGLSVSPGVPVDAGCGDRRRNSPVRCRGKRPLQSLKWCEDLREEAANRAAKV